jgi:capsular exopolysaccharide synthesis family protein
LLWTLGSAGLMALVHDRVRPRYEAVSTIKVDPGDSRENASTADFEVFKETQVRRVTNPNVVASALAEHPDLLTLPGLAAAKDPEAAIRQAVTVAILPRTNLIQVSMSSESPEEAPAVVNAVIESYLKVALDSRHEPEASKQARKLRQARDERTLAVLEKRRAIADLVKRTGTTDGAQARDRNSVMVEQYGVLTRQLLDVDLELVEAQGKLDQLRAVPSLSALPDPSEPEPEVVTAFYATPAVAEARLRFERAREVLADAERIAKGTNDPSQTSARKQVDECQRQLDILWTRMKPGLIKTHQAQVSRVDERLVLEARVASLKTRQGQLNDRLEKLNVQTKAAGADEITLEFARQDLTRAEAVLDSVTKSLDLVEFEAKAPVARFTQEYQAKAALTPEADHRTKVMAAAPLGMLLGVLACLVLVELRAARVYDPEELPARLQLPVLGVVPPLPRSRSNPGELSTRDEVRSRRDLNQFIQSLDHLRVAICSGRDAWGRPRRSIMITSACGSEGKTTLAAQLAERCVNAGLLTLLVDADIRNPTLSRMFDHAACRGLVNVLRGEAMAEEAITVIGGAGGFHFLPAGSPRVDPSRLLHGDRLSKLLASARESFDIVLVDCPPVLPVPDALTIGRWVDGAVLAVRYDNSRYPLVERANQRLASVGVPVIGAVLNGVKGPDEAYYGNYGSMEDGGDALTY